MPSMICDDLTKPYNGKVTRPRDATDSSVELRMLH